MNPTCASALLIRLVSVPLVQPLAFIAWLGFAPLSGRAGLVVQLVATFTGLFRLPALADRGLSHAPL